MDFIGKTNRPSNQISDNRNSDNQHPITELTRIIKRTDEPIPGRNEM